MSIRLGGTLYLIAAIIQIFMPNLATLIVGRCIQGLGVGMLSMTVPIYQCEIAPGHGRGLFVSIEYLCLNSGYALSAWVGYAFFYAMPSEISWRGPYAVQAGLAVILIIWTFFLPETPRWLVKNGFKRDGFAALADLHAKGDLYDPAVSETYASIEAAIILEEGMGEATWAQLFTQYTRRTVVGITCQLFAQFNGINAILYFLPENLSRAGFDVGRSLLYSGACALVYCAGTVPTMFMVDRWGRRLFLLVGSVGLAAALALVGGLQYHEEALPLGSSRMSSADGIFVGQFNRCYHRLKTDLFHKVSASICSYSVLRMPLSYPFLHVDLPIFRWGPIPWLLGAEIFPLRARAKGMALSTSVNWISNFVIAFITPPLFSAVDAGYYFLLLGFCLISGIFVWFMYPETAGKTLEELGQVFKDGKVQLGGKENGLRQDRPDNGGSDVTLGSTTGTQVVGGPLDMLLKEGELSESTLPIVGDDMREKDLAMNDGRNDFVLNDVMTDQSITTRGETSDQLVSRRSSMNGSVEEIEI